MSFPPSKLRWALLCLPVALVAGVFSLSGQLLPPATTADTVHSHDVASVDQSAVTMIDGAQTPDLIPDSAAYRLVLTNISSQNPSAEEAARQLAFLNSAGLEGDDIQVAIPILADFNAQFDDMIGSYNRSVDAANAIGLTPDLRTFTGQRDALVQSTLTALSTALSPVGLSRFRAYVKSEKSRMRVPAKEAQ